jgi:hypothetical protein
MPEGRILAAKVEVQQLLDANVIREVKYSDWLANVVIVPKKNGKMRMCIDFIDLNKVCKKGPFPLPRIEPQSTKQQVVEDSHSWTISQCITKFGSRKKTKRKPALQHPSAPTAT